MRLCHCRNLLNLSAVPPATAHRHGFTTRIIHDPGSSRLRAPRRVRVRVRLGVPGLRRRVPVGPGGLRIHPHPPRQERPPCGGRAAPALAHPRLRRGALDRHVRPVRPRTPTRFHPRAGRPGRGRARPADLGRLSRPDRLRPAGAPEPGVGADVGQAGCGVAGRAQRNQRPRDDARCRRCPATAGSRTFPGRRRYAPSPRSRSRRAPGGPRSSSASSASEKPGRSARPPRIRRRPPPLGRERAPLAPPVEVRCTLLTDAPI